MSNSALADRGSLSVNFGLHSRRVRPIVKTRSHRHAEIELNYLERGWLVYQHAGQRVRLPAGALAVFWAGVPHHIVELEPGTEMHWLTLPLDSFVQWQLPDWFVERILSGGFVIQNGLPDEAPESAAFRRWRGDLSCAWPERRKVLLLELEARLRRMALDLAGTPTQPNRDQGASGSAKANEMARFMASHYAMSLTVAQIAQTVGLHPNYAGTVFRRHFHMTILEYLTQYRIAHAQRLLLLTDAPVSAVAREAGFGSISQFHDVFKRLCGLPPKKYRARTERV